jgi:hypothetical protein
MALGDDGEDENGHQSDPDRDGDPAENPHSPILAVGRTGPGQGRAWVGSGSGLGRARGMGGAEPEAPPVTG